MKRLVVTVTEETVEVVSVRRWKEVRSWPPMPDGWPPMPDGGDQFLKLPQYVKDALPKTDHAAEGETYGYVYGDAEKEGTAEVFRLELPPDTPIASVAQAVLSAING